MCVLSPREGARLTLVTERSWHEVFTERGDPADPDEAAQSEAPDGCSVCGGPGALRECVLDSSAQPEGGWAIASIWHVCSTCLATITVGDSDALKGRLRPEDRTAPVRGCSR
jgi:hypothetical protein